MGLFKALGRILGKVIKPVSKIIKPLAIAGAVYSLIRRRKKRKVASPPTPRQYPITPPPQAYRPPIPPLPPIPPATATMQMLKLLNNYIANLRQVANTLTEDRAKQIRDIMAARGLLRSGWTAKAIGRLPSEVWAQLAPQLQAVTSQVAQAMASDWYTNYLKHLSKWQSQLGWW